MLTAQVRNLSLDSTSTKAVSAPLAAPEAYRKFREATQTRAELMTGDGWCMYASANFQRSVLGCITADFYSQILVLIVLTSTCFVLFFSILTIYRDL